MLSIKTNFLARLKFQSVKAHQMSRWCTKLHFFVRSDPRMVCEWLSAFRSGSFFIPPPTETGEHPRGYREGGCGGLPKCLHMVWVLIILLYSFGQRAHDLPRCILTTCLTIAQNCGTPECACVFEIWLWLKATRRGEAFPDLVSPSGIPANRHGQTAISHLKAWKNGEHLTRKCQDFWTFNLPFPPLYSATITTAYSWHTGDIQPG